MRIKFENRQLIFNNVWFLSDTHLSHANIIKLCNRPFDNIFEMDECILNNINNSVKNDDLLVFLGDFCQWKDKPTISFYSFMNRINCMNWIWIYGNHDVKIKNQIKHHNKVLWAGDLLDLEVDGQGIVLCHYPLKTWNKAYHGSWHLFGHVHNNDNYTSSDGMKSLNVCVEQIGYTPLSFTQLKNRLANETNTK